MMIFGGIKFGYLELFKSVEIVLNWYYKLGILDRMR